MLGQAESNIRSNTKVFRHKKLQIDTLKISISLIHLDRDIPLIKFLQPSFDTYEFHEPKPQ